jgi:hypothetical protein
MAPSGIARKCCVPRSARGLPRASWDGLTKWCVPACARLPLHASVESVCPEGILCNSVYFQHCGSNWFSPHSMLCPRLIGWPQQVVPRDANSCRLMQTECAVSPSLKNMLCPSDCRRAGRDGPQCGVSPLKPPPPVNGPPCLMWCVPGTPGRCGVSPAPPAPVGSMCRGGGSAANAYLRGNRWNR